MFMHILVIIAVILLLVFINSFYVAAEFSAVSARRPRLAQMAAEGNGAAQKMLAVLIDPVKLDRYVAACQLGITVSSLVVGYYGQSQIMALLQPWLNEMDPTTRVAAQSILALIILAVLTTFQVVLGELAPKNIGVQYPEKLSTMTAAPMNWSILLFRPLIAIFNGSAQILLRLFGMMTMGGHAHVHSPEEIMMLVEESSAGGRLDAEERRLLVNTLQLRDLTAEQVMLPRSRMLAASVDKSCQELFMILAQSPYSRLPIYDGSIDNIIGVIHLKDLLTAATGRSATPDQSGARQESAPCVVRELLRPVAYLPDSLPVDQALAVMQREHRNMGIVLDEYGGTSGLLTFEDLVEEIIGEFEDEFDEENPPVALRGQGRLMVRGDVLIADLNEALNLTLPAEAAHTIGGLVLRELGRPPQPGDTVPVDDLILRVDAVKGNGAQTISFRVTPDQAERLEQLGGEI
ncbi:MAG: HlyC/CorC family transporter [Caldilineaceae bacterium]|nr:HlyC/CorC family transporter [Caldilineaceae bacterium]